MFFTKTTLCDDLNVNFPDKDIDSELWKGDNLSKESA